MPVADVICSMYAVLQGWEQRVSVHCNCGSVGKDEQPTLLRWVGSIFALYRGHPLALSMYE